MLGALRRAIDEQQRHGRGNHVNDADQRFLRNASRPGTRKGEQQRGD
jgi:hypothetical protein